MQARVEPPVKGPAVTSPDVPAWTAYDDVRRLAGRDRRPEVVLPLEPLIAEFTALACLGWNPRVQRKHATDFARFLAWLAETGRPATTASLDLPTLAAFVGDLRRRPKVIWVWRGTPGAAERAASRADRPLSANTVHSYVRPLRSLAGWLADEGLLPVDLV